VFLLEISKRGNIPRVPIFTDLGVIVISIKTILHMKFARVRTLEIEEII
jgi:hypothetical protein